MLVLTRKKRASVAVGCRHGGEPMPTATVLEIGSGKVKLGFHGDPDVSVHRSELWERIRPRVARRTIGRGDPDGGSPSRWHERWRDLWALTADDNSGLERDD